MRLQQRKAPVFFLIMTNFILLILKCKSLSHANLIELFFGNLDIKQKIFFCLPLLILEIPVTFSQALPHFFFKFLNLVDL
jgi:hypothetical protein